MKLARAVAVLATILWLGWLSTARGGDGELVRGTWVTVKGHYTDRDIFIADDVELTEDRSASVKGNLDDLSVTEGMVRIGGLRLPLQEDSRFQDADGAEISPGGIAPGARVKLALDVDDPAGPRVKRVRLLKGSSDRLSIEGPMESDLLRRGNSAFFKILGVEVRATPRTDWEGIRRPVIEVDDEDYRPGRGLQLGNMGRLSGEFRLDFKGESNFDLFDPMAADVETGRGRTRLEWTLPHMRRVSGMVQIKAQQEEEITDEADHFDKRSDLTLGRAYVMLHGVLSRYGSIQVGRSRFDDRRDWLYNRDVDALRFFFYFRKLHVEASASEELVDPTNRHRDIFNSHVRLTFRPGDRHSVGAYVFDRHDRFRRPNGNLRDFSPRYYGLSLSGEGRRLWSYWLEAALARGSMERLPLRGHALDAGLTLIGPWRLEPSITLGYAFGSGDDDPFDDVDHTFRQTGLHANNGKWNGVSSFAYYGELVDPELANLHIETVGLGLKPLKRTSIDLVFHRYRLDVAANELVDANVDDRRLNLIDLDIGREWDLVIGFEELEHWEFELDLGYFRPGRAFLGPTDDAFMTKLKIKFIF